MFNLSKAKIGIVGLGYVGLPLAFEFSKKFPTIGFDTDNTRIQELKNGIDTTLEINNFELLSPDSNLVFTNDINDIQECNIYIITVLTPIDAANKPDLTPLMQASKNVGKVLNQNDLVIYESTVYPGVTEDICVPELEKASGLRFNEDFSVAIVGKNKSRR